MARDNRRWYTDLLDIHNHLSLPEPDIVELSELRCGERQPDAMTVVLSLLYKRTGIIGVRSDGKGVGTLSFERHTIEHV